MREDRGLDWEKGKDIAERGDGNVLREELGGFELV